MSITGIGSSMSSSVIGQMMSRMQTRGSSESASSAISGKQKPDLAALVTQLDTDSSGSLESTEIADLAEKISQATGVSTDLTEFMNTYDTNTDASLSTDEAVAALEANPPQGPPPGGMGGPGGAGGSMEKELANSADSNGDGTIDSEEAQSLVGFINNATGSSLEVEDFMSTYNTDGEAGLTSDEAVAALEANRPEGPPPPPPSGGMGGMGGTGASMESDLVSSADSNGDGTISADEAQGLVDFINTATGSSLSVDDFMKAADSDGENGVSVEEAVAGVESHRPEAPTSSQAEGSSLTAMALETYMNMSAMGANNQSTEDLYSLLGNASNAGSRVA